MSAVGSCDDSVGEENRSFAQSIVNEMASGVGSTLSDFDINIENVAEDISIEFLTEEAFIRAKIERPLNLDYVYKIFVNGNDFTLAEFTNANEILFDNDSSNISVQLKLFDRIGQTAETNVFRYTPQEISNSTKVSGELSLENTGG